MPTIYHNLLTIKDEGKADEVFETMGTEESAFDFNVIVPKPESFEHGDDEIHWACDNWGTKWNAFEAKRIGRHHMYFQTAWCGVEDMIEKVAEKFEIGDFMYTYSSEFRDERMGGVTRDGGKVVRFGSPADAIMVEQANKALFGFLESHLGPIEIPDLSEEAGWFGFGGGMMVRICGPDGEVISPGKLGEIIKENRDAGEEVTFKRSGTPNGN